MVLDLDVPFVVLKKNVTNVLRCRGCIHACKLLSSLDTMHDIMSRNTSSPQTFKQMYKRGNVNVLIAQPHVC